MDLPKRPLSSINLRSRPRLQHQREALEAAAANGVGFYVTPTTDIVLWAPDVTFTRLSSPTT